MLKTKLTSLILAVLTTISCAGSPTTPTLPVPVKPQYPKFTPAEIELLSQCKKGQTTCVATYSILQKIAIKDVMCRSYASELRSVIVENNDRNK